MFLVAIFFNNCAINNRAVSKQIKKSEEQLLSSIHGGCNDYFIRSYDKLRKEIDFIEKINPNMKSDTIYLLESVCNACLNSDLYLAIWNKNKILYYYYSGPDTQLYVAKKEYSLFPQRMIDLVSKWDIEGLNLEREKYSVLGGHQTKIAFRIIFKNRKYQIDCIAFKTFFNFKRDYTLYYNRPEYLIPVYKK